MQRLLIQMIITDRYIIQYMKYMFTVIIKFLMRMRSDSCLCQSSGEYFPPDVFLEDLMQCSSCLHIKSTHIQGISAISSVIFS